MTGAPASAPKARARILVIEDEPSVAAFLRSALERRGYEVTEFVVRRGRVCGYWRCMIFEA